MTHECFSFQRMTDSEKHFPKNKRSHAHEASDREFSSSASTNYKARFTKIFCSASQTELASSLTAPRRNAISRRSLSTTSGNRYPLKGFPEEDASHT
jgi:hypothetical protein